MTPSPLKTREYAIKPSEMASLLNSSWQNRKESPNRSTNNEDITETPKRPVGE